MASTKMDLDDPVPTDVDQPKGHTTTTNGEIDESLYSRQLYVLGHEAMKRMGSSHILICGLKGLGVEIAKNIALAGVKSLTLFDPDPAKIEDLSSQFFLHPEDVGKPRAEVTAPRVAELNSYTPVSVYHAKNLTSNLEDLKKFQVVVLTGVPMKEQIQIADFCHDHGVFVVIADTFGLFGSIFTDFGPEFACIDPTGEEPLNGIVADIAEDGTVSALDEVRHGLEDGNYVTFTEVEGMSKLNNAEPRQITVNGPYTFSIGSVEGLGKYERGGLYQQVKMPKKIAFKKLSDSLKAPEFLLSDFAKFDRPAQLHWGIQALHEFAEKKGALPRPHNDADAAEVLQLTKDIQKLSEQQDVLDEKVLKELSYQARGDLSPMAAFFGGLAAQEVLKSVSGKFHPLVQHMYFDSLESLPILSAKRSEELCAPTKSRYDGQIAVFGKDFQANISNMHEFLVGAGAIGCEMLKGWAMIGLATGPSGKIHVADMDSIEKSNLNRQFLFRPKDVGKMKSDCATAAVQAMNTDLKGKIQTYRDGVGQETESIYDEAFWQNLDGVTNALDNVAAREYVDRRCVFFKKPLLESGTLGTKGNTQVVLPLLTESYASTRDPPEPSYPICTLKSFPNKIEHTIAWAKSQFQEYFTEAPDTVNLYMSQPDFIKTTLKNSQNAIQQLRWLRDYIVADKPSNFEDCIVWARNQFEREYNHNIRQLLYNFPLDAKTSTGAAFWSGPKRAPVPLKFSVDNPTYYGYVVAGANLHAFNYGIQGGNKYTKEQYTSVLDNMIVPDFHADPNVKIQTDEKEAQQEKEAPPAMDQDEEMEDIVKKIPKTSELGNFKLQPVDFEKDDDTNHHIDFITASSNCRAENYAITVADRHRTKFIAGKIIPAIATTTAMVTGLVGLEMYKVVDCLFRPEAIKAKESKSLENVKIFDDIERFKSAFVNLALPFIGFGEPIASPKGSYTNKQGQKVEIDKLWDRFEVEDVTLTEFLKWMEEKGLTVMMMSSDVSLLYASFYPAAKLKDRLGLKLSELVETVSRKKLGGHEKSLIVEVTVEDGAEEDVEVPFVRVLLGR